MTRHNILLGRILGIPIGLDYSWFVIFALLTWMLADSYYPLDASAFVVSSHASGDNTRQKSRHNYSCGLGERSSWQKIMKSSGTLATSLSRFESIR
jgi:hypothetical protein